jgi:hypothetical protein
MQEMVVANLGQAVDSFLPRFHRDRRSGGTGGANRASPVAALRNRVWRLM